MPCGGIYPIKTGWLADFTSDDDECWFNDGPVGVNGLFCEEWDTSLHKSCLKRFMVTDEGRIVLEHGHTIDNGDA